MNGGRSILPAFGLVDVHSHILPGMDDGARDVAESVDLLRLSYRQDVRHMWATPHFFFSYSYRCKHSRCISSLMC